MFKRKTIEVFVGKIGIGANNPIRIQSMTTTNTRDVDSTVTQTKLLADKGCEIVRFTVQGMKEALACELIKDKLTQQGYDIPLVADIHFFPAAALQVIDFVEKVRINPGNFSDKAKTLSSFQNSNTLSEQDFLQHTAKIENKLGPLIEKCKKQNKSIRIGVNHGSLSERIMQKYGNTIEGMVFSAIEYMQVCHKFNFHNIIFSMKSSNPQIMIAAYRNLCHKIDSLNFSYPMHLGVTESGNNLDGRIKSSIGIGSLLLEGIGDTIRVSLTEPPENEITPCKYLISLSNSRLKSLSKSKPQFFVPNTLSSFSSKISYSENKEVLLGIELTCKDLINPNLENILEKNFSEKKFENQLIVSEEISQSPLFSIIKKKKFPYIVKNNTNTLTVSDAFFKKPYFSSQPIVILNANGANRVDSIKSFFHFLKTKQNKETYKNSSFLISFNYTTSLEATTIFSGAELGALLNDNLGNGIVISAEQLLLEEKISLGLSILQGTRKRFTKTEFIACPTCGRTLFDLPSVLEKIKKRTSHLPGIKIAIMGCIVNGPGEMADADFGFVGSQPGKVDLYVKHERVKSSIDMDKAEEALVNLLEEYQVWKEPVS